MCECNEAYGCSCEANDQKAGNVSNDRPTTLTATMEVAGVESIPGSTVQPQSIGLSYDEDQVITRWSGTAMSHSTNLRFKYILKH